MTQKYKLLIEYDGAGFCGWQSQKQGCGVQDALAQAFEKFCGEQVVVYGAGRTDTGVHARGQVGHVVLATKTDAATLRKAVNQHLKPKAVAILAAEEVAEDFDARFSATQRRYCYRFIARAAPLGLDRGRAWHLPQKLNVTAMQEAASVLVGAHDFSTFRSVHCQAASPIKTIDAIEITERDGASGQEVLLQVAARSFLHNQIRSFAGALKWVGEGKWSAQNVQTALAACDRASCPPVAPPEGLTFMQVRYAEK